MAYVVAVRQVLGARRADGEDGWIGRRRPRLSSKGRTSQNDKENGRPSGVLIRPIKNTTHNNDNNNNNNNNDLATST